MSTPDTVSNILITLQALQETVPPSEWADTPLPVIAGPASWMEEVRRDLGVEPGVVLDSIHGCPVLENNALTEPTLITHDGKMYPALPGWMRAKEAAV